MVDYRGWQFVVKDCLQFLRNLISFGYISGGQIYIHKIVGFCVVPQIVVVSVRRPVFWACVIYLTGVENLIWCVPDQLNVKTTFIISFAHFVQSGSEHAVENARPAQIHHSSVDS